MSCYLLMDTESKWIEREVMHTAAGASRYTVTITYTKWMDCTYIVFHLKHFLNISLIEHFIPVLVLMPKHWGETQGSVFCPRIQRCRLWETGIQPPTFQWSFSKRKTENSNNDNALTIFDIVWKFKYLYFHNNLMFISKMCQ